MQINLNNIFTHDEIRKQLSADFDFSAEDISIDATFDEPVHMDAVLERGNSSVALRLSVKASSNCTCARCLKSFKKDYDFTREFYITRDVLTDPDNELFLEEDGTLDLELLTRQELTLEVPFILLCREDCPGLCPVCGRPKEEGCTCEVPEWTDPRLSVFDQLTTDDE